MIGKSIHLQIIPQKSTQNAANYRQATKTSGLFLLYYTGVGYNSRNNFSNLGSFAKVSVPLQSIISWLASLNKLLK